MLCFSSVAFDVDILLQAWLLPGDRPKAVRGHRGEETSRNQVSLLDEFFLGKGGAWMYPTAPKGECSGA